MHAHSLSPVVWLLLGTMLAGCAPTGAADRPEVPPVRVAAGPDAESTLLGHVMAALLEAGGLPAEVVPFADARDARRALDLGEVEARIGYTGEAWLETMGRADPPGDPIESFRAVRDHDAQAGIVWLRPVFSDDPMGPPANATFAFVVQGPPSVDADLRTMSQLAARLSAQPDALVCVDREFAERPDGLSAVLSVYSVRSDRPFLAADPADAVLGVAAGECLAGLTTATDGDAWRSGLHPLVDDLRVFPAFVPLPQVREDALAVRPGLGPALGPMAANLSTRMLGRLNARVRAGDPVDDIARDAAVELRARSGIATLDAPG
jgi:osmoprotectant transport system substrate-binding protein